MHPKVGETVQVSDGKSVTVLYESTNYRVVLERFRDRRYIVLEHQHADAFGVKAWRECGIVGKVHASVPQELRAVADAIDRAWYGEDAFHVQEGASA